MAKPPSAKTSRRSSKRPYHARPRIAIALPGLPPATTVCCDRLREARLARLSRPCPYCNHPHPLTHQEEEQGR